MLPEAGTCILLALACPAGANKNERGWKINTVTANHHKCMPQSRTTPMPIIMPNTLNTRHHVQAAISSAITGVSLTLR